MSRTKEKAPRIVTKSKNPDIHTLKYRPEFVELAHNYCLLGATNNELAEFFEVNVKVIYDWVNRYPEFKEALRAGKEEADGRVANSLYQRAKGFICDDTDLKVIDGEIVATKVKRYYPPDTTACIFWLKNRRPGDWRDKHIMEQEGPITVEVTKFSDGN